jgi:hypothetical protein
MSRITARYLALLVAVAISAQAQGNGGKTYSPTGQARGPARPAGLRPADPLRSPTFIPAAQASFLKDSDLVLGVSDGGVSRAYLTVAVVFHHIIDDKLGKQPIMVTW